MKLVKIQNQGNSGHMLINVEKIIYIQYNAPCAKNDEYASIYFSEGRAGIVLNKEQYTKLMLACEKFAGEE